MHSIIFICFGVWIAFCLAISRARRLRGVPGPWICTFTDAWRVYQQNRRNISIWLGKMHDTYGPIVKIGPNTVSVCKASAVPIIYTMHGEYKKADSYYTLSTMTDGKVNRSVIDIQDETRITLLKRGFGSAFSIRNVQRFENLVDASSRGLLDRMGTKGTVDIFDAFRRFQIDFLLQAAFSQQSFACNTEEDIESYTFQPLANHWHRWQGLPKLETYVFKSHVLEKIKRVLFDRVRPIWVVMTNSILEGRMSGKTSSQGKEDLLDQWLGAHKKHSEMIDVPTVRLMVASTVNAGFDSTAFTMTAATYYLLKNPSAKAALQKEIRDARDAGLLSDQPQWDEVNKLPYLDAVIKETMRLSPFVNLPLERIVPDEGVELFDHYLPPGTVVGCAASVVGQDTECYGDDTPSFNPSRWLTAEQPQLVAMSKGALGFGSGKRACMGRHIAYLEMKKTLSFLFSRFDAEFEYKDPPFEFIDGITSFVKPIYVRFTRV